jgi:hypothetical protein
MIFLADVMDSGLQIVQFRVAAIAAIRLRCGTATIGITEMLRRAEELGPGD